MKKGRKAGEEKERSEEGKKERRKTIKKVL